MFDKLSLFADAARLQKDQKAAEALLRELRVETRGHACVMGVIALGPQAPAHWRQQAMALLFADERPWLQ
jgi:hypothetical protein